MRPLHFPVAVCLGSSPFLHVTHQGGTRGLWPLADPAWILFLDSNPLRLFPRAQSASTSFEIPKFTSFAMHRCTMSCWYHNTWNQQVIIHGRCSNFSMFRGLHQYIHVISVFLNDSLTRICFWRRKPSSNVHLGAWFPRETTWQSPLIAQPEDGNLEVDNI